MKKYQPGANMQVLFICPKCGRQLAWALPAAEMQCPRQLAWALPAAEMQCPKCGTWVNNKNRKGRGHDVFLPPGSDQTVLF